MAKKHKILIIILVVIIAILTFRVVFDSKFDDLDNLIQWEKEYKIANPDATKEEIDNAFKEGFKGLEKWTENYKKDHPDATDAEIDQAFKEAWGN